METKNKNQIRYNKDDVERLGKLKIDILSNNGLSQLFDISKMPLEDYPESDLKTEALLCNGDNIGITFMESPVARRSMICLQSHTIKQLALCLAFIRPVVSGEGGKANMFKNLKSGNPDASNYIIFDDDAIKYIKKLINCDESTADKYRKAFAKRKWNDLLYFDYIIQDFRDKDKIIGNLNQLRKYSFCKAHSLIRVCKSRNTN